MNDDNNFMVLRSEGNIQISMNDRRELKDLLCVPSFVCSLRKS